MKEKKKKEFYTLWYFKLYPVRPSTLTMGNSFVWVTHSHCAHIFYSGEQIMFYLLSPQAVVIWSIQSSLSLRVVSLSAISDLYSTVRLSADTYQYLHIFNIIIHAERRQHAYLENGSLTLAGTTFDYCLAGRNIVLYFDVNILHYTVQGAHRKRIITDCAHTALPLSRVKATPAGRKDV